MGGNGMKKEDENIVFYGWEESVGWKLKLVSSSIFRIFRVLGIFDTSGAESERGKVPGRKYACEDSEEKEGNMKNRVFFCIESSNNSSLGSVSGSGSDPGFDSHPGSWFWLWSWSRSTLLILNPLVDSRLLLILSCESFWREWFEFPGWKSPAIFVFPSPCFLGGGGGGRNGMREQKPGKYRKYTTKQGLAIGKWTIS